MRRAFFFVLASFLWLTAPSVAMAQIDEGTSVALTTDQARALAIQSVRAGNFPAADAISTAILQDNPNDADMLLVRAILAREAGDFATAEDLAARAYDVSDTPNTRFEASMLSASILIRQEKYFRAEFWLRRADQSATTPRQEQAAAQVYRRVQEINPLTVQFRFTARPSNNVNNGAEELEIEIGGLPFRLSDSGQQLGGFEASAGVSLSYRLSQSEIHRTEVLGELFYRHIWLNSKAKDLAPDVEGSDFNYGVIIAGLRHDRLIWPELGPSQVTGIVGHSWYGDEELARWFELSARQSVRVGDSSVLGFGTLVRTEKRLDDEINDSHQLLFSVDYRAAADRGGSYGIGARIRNYWSDSATVDRFATEVYADRFFEQIGPIVPWVRLSLENQNYHKFTTTADGREDQTVSLDMSARIPDVRFYGFIPEASIRLRKTDSNVNIYDRNEYSFGITAVSRF